MVSLETLIGSGGGLIAGGVIGWFSRVFFYEYKKRDQQKIQESNKRDQWYNTTIQLANEIQDAKREWEGVTAPRRATFLIMVIRQVSWDGTESSGDGARGASRRPRKQASGRPLRALTHRPGPPARRVTTPSRRRRSAADCDKFGTLGVEPSFSAVARHRFLYRTHISEAVSRRAL